MIKGIVDEINNSTTSLVTSINDVTNEISELNDELTDF
jgi:hypothetical protein